jgi:hypothetical protein
MGEHGTLAASRQNVSQLTIINEVHGLSVLANSWRAASINLQEPFSKFLTTKHPWPPFHLI